MHIFQQRLKARRIKLGLTQTELAHATSLTPAAISAFESGKREPYFESFQQLTNTLDCSADYLLGRINTPHWNVSIITENPDLKSIADYLLKGNEHQNQHIIDIMSGFFNFYSHRTA